MTAGFVNTKSKFRFISNIPKEEFGFIVHGWFMVSSFEPCSFRKKTKSLD